MKRTADNLSEVKEDYLETILLLSKGGAPVRLIDISKAHGVSKSTVSDLASSSIAERLPESSLCRRSASRYRSSVSVPLSSFSPDEASTAILRIYGYYDRDITCLHAPVGRNRKMAGLAPVQ